MNYNGNNGFVVDLLQETQVDVVFRNAHLLLLIRLSLLRGLEQFCRMKLILIGV